MVCFYGFQCNSSAVCESLKGFFCDLQTAWRLVLSMKPWSYIWLEFGLFSTIIYICVCVCRYITVTSWWVRWRLKSPASPSTFYSGADQRKHQSSASLAFVREIHRWPVNSLHKWPVTGKMLPFDDVIVNWIQSILTLPDLMWNQLYIIIMKCFRILLTNVHLRKHVW